MCIFLFLIYIYQTKADIPQNSPNTFARINITETIRIAV